MRKRAPSSLALVRISSDASVVTMLRNFAETGKGCELVDEEGLTQVMQGIDMMLNPMQGIQSDGQ